MEGLKPYRGAVSADEAQQGMQTWWCPYDGSAPSLEIIDADGDLFLEAGANVCLGLPPEDTRTEEDTGTEAGAKPAHIHTKGVVFKVDSRALARACRPWKTMLTAGFAESKPGDGSEWRVQLPEDNPNGMRTILQILHGRFEHVPPKRPMSLRHLYDITIITEKYFLDRILKPWITAWGNHFESPIPDPDDWDLELFLWVYWVLGYKEGYFKTLLSMAFNSALVQNENGQFNVGGSLYRQDGRECLMRPPNSTEIIEKRRVDLIEELVRFVKNPFNGVYIGHSISDSWTRTKRCESCEFGDCAMVYQHNLTSYLDRLDHSPFPKASEYSGSPKSLVEDLEWWYDLDLRNNDTCCHNCRYFITYFRLQGVRQYRLNDWWDSLSSNNQIMQRLNTNRHQSGLEIESLHWKPAHKTETMISHDFWSATDDYPFEEAW